MASTNTATAVSTDDLLSTEEKRFLDVLLQHFNQLATEAKKKHPHVKEACETGIIRVRNASSPRIISAMGLRASIMSESQQILEPFFIGCDTRAPKMVQTSINAMQKLIIFEALNENAAGNLLICLWNLMEHGIEEVKILQTITLLITTNQLVTGLRLAKTFSLCFRLHYTKNATTNNTASATIRQLVTILFERVQAEDKTSDGGGGGGGGGEQDASVKIVEDMKSIDKSKLFEHETSSNGDSVRFKPIQLRPAALDAFNFFQDLIQLINGDPLSWLSNLQQIEIARTFSLELLELIIDQYADTFIAHAEFAFLLKEKVCQLVIKLFSPNIKQRAGGQFSSFFSPLLGGSTSNTNTNSSSVSGSNVSSDKSNSSGSSSGHSTSSSSAAASAAAAAAAVQVSHQPYWPITVRLMRIVSVLIRNFFSTLVTESEIFFSLLVKSLEVDKMNWQRSLALEALHRMITPNLISSLCRNYDMKPQSSKILRDIVNALCIYIQSQFQVVDSSTTQSLLTSLVNNTNSGNTVHGFIPGSNTGGNVTNSSGGSGNSTNDTRPSASSSASNPNRSSAFPVFNLRSVSISLLFVPFHKTHRYKPFYIEQLEKSEPPAAPEGHGLSTALACIFEFVSTLSAIITQDLGQSIDTQLNTNNNNNTKQISLNQLTPETRQLHEHMLDSTFCGFAGTFSLLLDASTDEIITDLILEQMRKLISFYGLYNLQLARDAMLISMCKSAMPANYYSVAVLDPCQLGFDASYLPTPCPTDSLPSSGSLALSVNHSITNAAINLPNLLSQQNSHQSTNGNGNGSGGGVSSMDGAANAATNSNGALDVSRQIIAVGTPLPTAAPTIATNTNGSSNNQQVGPVMLTSKNLQCMSSLLSVSNSTGYVYDEKSWQIVFTTLQHLVWILGLKPNQLGVYRLGSVNGQQQQQHTRTASLTDGISSGSSSNSTTGSTGTVITNAAMSDLPVLTTMLSRLFECTQYLTDESLSKLIKALIALSNESLEVAYNNREPSLFALAKLLETSLVNLKRVNLLWNLVIVHFIEVSSHPYIKLREWGVDVLCTLVKSVLTQPQSSASHLTTTTTGAQEETESAESDRNTNVSQLIPHQSQYLAALQSLSGIKFVDVRQKQIECCHHLLQSAGEHFTDGWPALFDIIESACLLQNEALIRCAFQCYQFIVSDLLPHIPSVYLTDCISCAVAFGLQLQELNVSLTAIGLIWNIADFLHSNQQKIQRALAEDGIQHKFVQLDLSFCEQLTPFELLWISLFKNLTKLCTDARLSVRKSSVSTLLSTLSTHGIILGYTPWKAIFFYALFPLMDSVKTLCSVASNERITYSENAISKQGSGYTDTSGSEYIIHYSRNTAFKQWCETQVLVLNGISRIICLKLDLFLIYPSSTGTVDETVGDSAKSDSGNVAKVDNDHETMLLQIWSLFFEFIYASALTANAEVSTSALKSFNDIVFYLSDYHVKRADLNGSGDSTLSKTILQTLAPVWKIIWKTWCNIGHNIGINKLVSPTVFSNDNAPPTTGSIQFSHGNGNVLSTTATVAVAENGTDVNNDGTTPSSSASSASDANTTVPTQVIHLPSQTFLCLLIKPLYDIFPKIAYQITENEFKSLSFVLQNAIATPFLNEPSVYSYSVSGSDQAMTQLQLEVIKVLEKMQQEILFNLAHLQHLLPLMYYQYSALSLYAVNIIPPHLSIFITSHFQHRFLPGELTSFNTASFYVFGERALKNAFMLYQSTYKEPVVIKTHILHSLIKAYKIPLCFKYSCPLQSTWKLSATYFVKTLELGLPLARKFPHDFISIWADLALTFEGFLFPINKPPNTQTLEEQQKEEALDVKVVEVIRDHIMLYAQQIPREFLLQIVSILNRGSIHSPSITSPMDINECSNRKLREDFARVCFQTLLQFSFFGPKGNPDLFIQNSGGKTPTSPEHTIGIVNKLAVASILKRFNDVIVKYVEDEQLCPCPLPRHRLSEISFVLKALATLITSLKEAPPGSVETPVWKQLIELYPRIVDCTMSNSPQVNKSIREVLHEYAYLLACPPVQHGPKHPSHQHRHSHSSTSSSTSSESTNGTLPKVTKSGKQKQTTAATPNLPGIANGQNEVKI